MKALSIREALQMLSGGRNPAISRDAPLHVRVISRDRIYQPWESPSLAGAFKAEHFPVTGGVAGWQDGSATILAERSETPLTFAEVAAANRDRADTWHDEADEWSLADWSNALCGEVGELANIIKKLRRIETRTKGSADGHDIGAPDAKTTTQLRAEAGDEIADVYLYLDLVARSLGHRVEDCVVAKFNRVSKDRGFPHRIGDNAAF